MKFIDNCTRKDFADLAEAAIELLKASMFEYWKSGGELNSDQSWMQSMNFMRSALASCGLAQPTYEEFRADLEQILLTRRRP